MAISGQVTLGQMIARLDAPGFDLDAVVREHGKFVYKVVYSVVRNHADAEDATQETFLRLWRNRKSWCDIRNPRAWLAKAAWRVAMSRKVDSPAVALEDVVEAVLELKSRGASPDDIASHGQMKLLLERLIAGLPGDLRQVLVLSSVEEMTAVEIAEVMGVSQAAVRARLFRARELLREKLAGLLERKHG